MAEQILHGADIVAVLKHMGGEGMAQCMRRDPFFDSGQLGSVANGFAQAGRAEVMAAFEACARIE
jgi:hypothetical protein